MSEIDILQGQINSELDLILDDFDGQDDLICFEKEKFIPIEYNVKNLVENFYSSSLDKPLKISFEDNNDSNCIVADISKDDFGEKYNKLNDICRDYIENNGISNTYVSLGLVEFDGYLAPCILIPIVLEKDQNDYMVFINFNQELQFNGILKFILDEEKVDYLMFEGNIGNFLKQMIELDDIEFYPEAYIGNFDLKFQHLLYDLNADKWDSIDEKYKLFKENRDEFVKVEKDRFRNSLQKNAEALGINDDVLQLKSLLSMGNSILVIADESTRDEIRSYFRDDDFESLVLELSENLSENDFYEDIINSELIIDEDIIELDNLVKKRDGYSKILDLINGDYSSFNISPKEIKARKDNFTQIIQDLNLKDFSFEIQNLGDYTEESCKEMEEQIKEITSHGEDIFNLQAHFSFDYLNSDEFDNLVKISKSIKKHIKYFSVFNKKLMEKYQIKMFKDLFSVNLLSNIFIFDKNPRFIENNDFDLLNDCLENFVDAESIDNAELDKYFQSDDDIIKSIDINLKYTELINNEIIPVGAIEFILDDFDNIKVFCKQFIRISYYIKKELYYIINFYNSFKFFEIDSNLLKMDNGLDDIENLINRFEMDIKTLVDFKMNYISFNILNDDVQNFIRFVYDNDFNNDEIGPIFWYNIYNSLLNHFLNDYECIDEERMLGGYDSEYDEIDSNLVYGNEQLLIQHVYSKPLELFNNEKTIGQKEDLIKNRDDVGQIRTMLTKYKDFITANKRIFLMDMDLVSQVLDESYENHFDYVIITHEFKYDLDRLSLLLRSKNKIIKV